MTPTQIHMSDIIGRCVVEGNLIVYRGVIIDHSSKNDRIFEFIDGLSKPARRALFSAHYRGGGFLELMWRRNPPAALSAALSEGRCISVGGERWSITKSRLVPE
jgi:hypothetical protein